MAVHGINHNLVGVRRRQNTRHITICIQRNSQFLCAVALDVIAPRRHYRVRLTGLGVLIRIASRIDSIFLLFGFESFEQLQGILLYCRLVIAYPAQHRTIGIEGECRVETELLFVHPVGNAVNDLIELTVLCHLALTVIVQQLHKIDVVVAYKGHLQTVGRPYRALLRTAVGQTLELAALDGINVKVGFVGTTIDALAVGTDQHLGAVRRHDVSIKGRDFFSLRIVDVEKHGRLLTGLKRILHNLLPILRDACIEVGTLDRIDTRHALCVEGSVDECLQTDRLGGKRHRSHKQSKS